LTGNSIYIQNPTLQLSKKINGNRDFVVPQTAGKFPKKLENGEQFFQEYDTIELSNQLSDNDKIGFKIKTTSNKFYLSNQFTKKHIVGHIQIPNKIIL